MSQGVKVVCVLFQVFSNKKHNTEKLKKCKKHSQNFHDQCI